MHHSPLKGKEGRTGAGLDAAFQVEALDVIVCGLRRDFELSGRLLRCVAGRDQSQDLDLAGRQTRDALARRPPRRLSCYGKHGFDGLPAKLSILDRGAKLRSPRCIGTASPYTSVDSCSSARHQRADKSRPIST